MVRQRAKEVYPLTRCLPIGIPGDDLLPGPFKMIQTPGLILVRNEYENTFRQIYTDGRKRSHRSGTIMAGIFGGQVGRRNAGGGACGFNDKGWLDGMGHPHSEALHLLERFHRRDFGHMDVEVTIDDPKVYTKSFSVKFTELLQPDSDVTEYFCNENEKDRPHIADK